MNQKIQDKIKSQNDVTGVSFMYEGRKKKKKKRFLKIKGKMIYEKITVLFEFFIKMCKKGSLGTEGG